MSFENPQALAAADLPQPERRVIASRQRVATVRAQANGCDKTRVSFEGPQALAAGDLPQPERIVAASR